MVVSEVSGSFLFLFSQGSWQGPNISTIRIKRYEKWFSLEICLFSKIKHTHYFHIGEAPPPRSWKSVMNIDDSKIIRGKCNVFALCHPGQKSNILQTLAVRAVKNTNAKLKLRIKWYFEESWSVAGIQMILLPSQCYPSLQNILCPVVKPGN